MKIHNGNGKSKSNLNVRARAKEKQTLEQEVRRSRVIGLHIKGLTQIEIARKLRVNQSTVSDDLRYIKEQANRNVVEVVDNLSFEYVKDLAVMNEMEKILWEILDFQIDPDNMDGTYIMNVNMTNKNKIAALTLLLEERKHRYEVVTGGTRSTRDFNGTTIMSHCLDMKEAMKTPEEREQEQIEEDRRLLNL